MFIVIVFDKFIGMHFLCNLTLSLSFHQVMCKPSNSVKVQSSLLFPRWAACGCLFICNLMNRSLRQWSYNINFHSIPFIAYLNVTYSTEHQKICLRIYFFDVANSNAFFMQSHPYPLPLLPVVQAIKLSKNIDSLIFPMLADQHLPRNYSFVI